jgi:small subunit ribosomal protein S11
MAKVEKKKKKNVMVEAVGQAHVQSTFNNIIISLTNNTGQVISWSSAGKMGFKGSKKNTPYAAQLAAEQASKEAMDLGLRKVKVFVKGPGAGRESAIRTIHNTGIEVLEIMDITPLASQRLPPSEEKKNLIHSTESFSNGQIYRTQIKDCP